MTTGGPHRLTITSAVADDSHELLRRVMRCEELAPGAVESAVWPDGSPGVALRETTVTRGTFETSAHDRAAHVLWYQSDEVASITLTSDEEQRELRVVPGDTQFVPAGATVTLSPGLVLAVITATGDAATVPGGKALSVPEHGTNAFQGPNRLTSYATGEAIRLERWKITQPQRLVVDADQPVVVTNLVEPVALLWAGGTELLGRCGRRLLPPGVWTVVPNGVAWLLVSRTPTG